MVKALFFDSSGVLMREGFTSGIKAYGLECDLPYEKLFKAAHDIKEWKEFTLGYITEEEYLKAVASNFEGKIDLEKLKNCILKDFQINSDLLKYLKTIKERFILGIISNNPKEWFDYCRKHFYLDGIFKIYAISSYIHIRKPNVGIFKSALDQAKIVASEALYIDNRPDRVNGALELGIKVIVFNNNISLINDLKDLYD